MATASTLPRVRTLDEEPELNKRHICDCACRCRIAHLRPGICALCEREDHWWSLAKYVAKIHGRNFKIQPEWTHHLIVPKQTRRKVT